MWMDKDLDGVVIDEWLASSQEGTRTIEVNDLNLGEKGTFTLGYNLFGKLGQKWWISFTLGLMHTLGKKMYLFYCIVIN